MSKVIQKAKHLKPGQSYLAMGAKGIFKIKVDKIEGPWIEGTILSGKLLSSVGNPKSPGEHATIHQNNFKFIE